MNIGPLELAIVLFVILLILGPKRLPALGRSLGGGMREFKDSITGRDQDDPELTAAPASPDRERADGLDGEVVPESRR